MGSTHDIGGGEANDLVRENLELVRQLVQQMAARHPRHVDRGALWRVGVGALLEGPRRFEPGRGIPCRRYAAIGIRGAIIASARSRGWASRRVRRQVRELEATEASLRARGDTPTEEELAEMV